MFQDASYFLYYMKVFMNYKDYIKYEDPLHQEISDRINEIIQDMPDELMDRIVEEAMDKTIREVFFEDKYGPI